MADAGIEDIFVPYNILGEAKLERLMRLAKRVRMSVTADSDVTVRGLAAAAQRAGCIIHAVGTNSMAEMGGLRRLMPITFGAMTVGLAALAGVPPFAGFFSKDAILGGK